MSGLKEKMASPIEEAELDAVFHRVEASLQPRPSRASRLTLPAVAVASLGLGVLVAYGASSSSSSSEVAAGPLRWQDGRAFEGLGGAREARLSDGSRIEVTEGAELRLVSNAADAFALALESGRVDLEVRPNGPRLWSVDAGDVRVEVLGTRFSVVRDEEVRVEVERGLVSVRWSGGTELVGPGESWASLDVGETVSSASSGAESASAMAEPGPESASEPAASELAASEAELGAASASESSRWRTLADRGAYDDAYAAVQRRGFRRSVIGAPDVETLFALADTARLSGHPAEALEPLRRIVEHHASDRRAGVAAFTLARLELESFGRRGESRRWLERALELGLGGSLREAAERRLRELEE